MKSDANFCIHLFSIQNDPDGIRLLLNFLLHLVLIFFDVASWAFFFLVQFWCK